MPKLIVFARLMFSSLLLILSACGLGDTTYKNRVVDNGHDVLYSKASARDGVVQFECKASDTGTCHYTLFPEACGGKPDCRLAPLQRFTVARGERRSIEGLEDFRVCVAVDGGAMGADCQPALAMAK